MESFGGVMRGFSTLQVGLTGSIGMGKSTISNQLMKLGIPLFDADREVHRLYAPNGAAVEPIRAAFPDAIVDGAVDRSKLTAKIMGDPSVLQTIEKIVHPLVVAGRENFYARACAERQLMVVYDIPLLFENLTKYNVDYIVVATAAADVQRRRVLERSGMTAEKFDAILAKQVPDAVKRAGADFLVCTDYEGYTEAKAQLAKAIEQIIEKNPGLWEEWKQGGTRGPNDEDGTTLLPTKLNRALCLIFVMIIYVCAEMTSRSSLTVSARSVRSAIDMVVFDLDDTLVPVASQLQRATAAMKAFMADHMPQTLRVVDSQLRHIMKR
jgi:dephospho-CoA kinase